MTQYKCWITCGKKKFTSFTLLEIDKNNIFRFPIYELNRVLHLDERYAKYGNIKNYYDIFNNF